MANEGSTKPTWVCVCRLLVSDYSKGAHVLCDVVAKLVRRESEAELARVRGLLQRIEGEFREDSPTEVWRVVKEIFGAESADIGKLDTADKSANWGISGNINVLPKSGVEMGKVNRVEESDAVCPGCHTRACNGECMRPMRFKGDTR